MEGLGISKALHRAKQTRVEVQPAGPKICYKEGLLLLFLFPVNQGFNGSKSDGPCQFRPKMTCTATECQKAWYRKSQELISWTRYWKETLPRGIAIRPHNVIQVIKKVVAYPVSSSLKPQQIHFGPRSGIPPFWKACSASTSSVKCC